MNHLDLTTAESVVRAGDIDLSIFFSNDTNNGNAVPLGFKPEFKISVFLVSGIICTQVPTLVSQVPGACAKSRDCHVHHSGTVKTTDQLSDLIDQFATESEGKVLTLSKSLVVQSFNTFLTASFHTSNQSVDFFQSSYIQNTVHLTDAADLSDSSTKSDQDSSSGAFTHISQTESLTVTLVNKLSSQTYFKSLKVIWVDQEEDQIFNSLQSHNLTFAVEPVDRFITSHLSRSL